MSSSVGLICSETGVSPKPCNVILTKINIKEKKDDKKLVKEIGDVLNASTSHEFNSDENNNYVLSHKIRRSNRNSEETNPTEESSNDDIDSSNIRHLRKQEPINYKESIPNGDPLTDNLEYAGSHDLRKQDQINYNDSEYEDSLNESLLNYSKIDEESIDSGSDLDNSFCAICKGYDDPELIESEADQQTQWIGCDCDRWYHTSCLSHVAAKVGLQLDHESFNCEQINNECIQ